MSALLHFFVFRPLLVLYFGRNVHYAPCWEKTWPPKGPAIIIANHNSNLDTPVIESLFPYQMLGKIHSIAAKDYWSKWKLLDVFARKIMRVIYVERGSGKSGKDPYEGVHVPLQSGAIVILYPEGTRGSPEKPSEIKKGIAHLMQQHPNIPVIPIFMYGLGKAQGQVNKWWKIVPLPFIFDVYVDAPIVPSRICPTHAEAHGEREQYLAEVTKRFQLLENTHGRGSWN